MKNFKKKDGITLIALVVTIVVLLILAGVSINLVVGNNGLIKKAQEAKEKTEQSAIEEQKLFSKVEAYTNLSNEYYYDNKGKRAVIPAGFAVSQVKGENCIDTGLVIIDSDGNEFVWIPVQKNEINQMAVLQEESDENYQGILYEFKELDDNVIAEEMQVDSIGGTKYREPDIVKWDGDKYDNDIEYLNIMNVLLEKDYSNSDEFLNDLQKDFNDMVKSIEKNEGFYIGRYELSINQEKDIYSKKGMLPATAAEESANSWYGLYSYSKLMSTKNNYSSVQSHMIWGCNWDFMLKYLLQGTSKTKVLSSENAPHDLGEIYTTGSVATDEINNIYDLEGNTREWTAEANYITQRVLRGGFCNYSQSPSSRMGRDPFNTYNNAGTRAILYIKN